MEEKYTKVKIVYRAGRISISGLSREEYLALKEILGRSGYLSIYEFGFLLSKEAGYLVREEDEEKKRSKGDKYIGGMYV